MTGAHDRPSAPRLSGTTGRVLRAVAVLLTASVGPIVACMPSPMGDRQEVDVAFDPGQSDHRFWLDLEFWVPPEPPDQGIENLMLSIYASAGAGEAWLLDAEGVVVARVTREPEGADEESSLAQVEAADNWRTIPDGSTTLAYELVLRPAVEADAPLQVAVSASAYARLPWACSRPEMKVTLRPADDEADTGADTGADTAAQDTGSRPSDTGDSGDTGE